MTKKFWRSEKKQTESKNIKILGGPLHVMYCIVVVQHVVVTMLPSGHDRYAYDSVDQWQSVHCEARWQCY